jgi:hypothetical protein
MMPRCRSYVHADCRLTFCPFVWEGRLVEDDGGSGSRWRGFGCYCFPYGDVFLDAVKPGRAMRTTGSPVLRRFEGSGQWSAHALGRGAVEPIYAHILLIRIKRSWPTMRALRLLARCRCWGRRRRLLFVVAHGRDIGL